MNSTSKQILIVDDDELVLDIVQRILARSGYKVHIANNGIEAIEICTAQKPDLAILDIHMPGINGIETAQQIQSTIATATPFVFFSACDDKDTITRAIECGALGYLVKPINVEQMILTIETAIHRSQDMKELHENKEKLIEALNNNRIISTAVGITMERQNLSQDAAFEALRSQSRQNRKKMRKVCARIIAKSDLMHKKNT